MPWHEPTFEAMLRACYQFATQSPDPRTKNAAIVARESFLHPYPKGFLFNEDLRSLGFNMLPDGVHYSLDRMERPEKHRRIIHAEAAAIAECAWAGIATRESTMFACWASCAECAKLIIHSGVRRVVTHQPEGFDEHGLPIEGEDTGHSRWLDSILLANEMFAEAGVEKVVVKGRLFEPGSFQIMRSGILIEP
jgi:deoxycytidylate deaminase